MFELIRENPGLTFLAFIITLVVVGNLVELWIRKRK